ncbi:MAG: histone deacetylase [Cyclobacteriaceae bacterium]
MLKIAWNPSYVLSLPPNHRFPMSKYEVLPEQLLHEGTISESNIFSPDTVGENWILATHEQPYWEKLQSLSLTPKEIRRTGFPLTRELVERECMIMGGTLQCVHYALSNGIAMNIAGGTHHAFSNRGEGFCLLNDIAIAANYLLIKKLASKILVVDLDVHQGNGTAEIFSDEPRVFTFSMHGASNYPMIKEHSDLDIGLPDGTEDQFYLKTLITNLGNIMEQFQPDFIFYQSGVDVLATDKLGKLSLTREGCKERDRVVLNVAKAASVPLVASMGGGYSPDFKDIIEAHANTYRLAQEIFF